MPVTDSALGMIANNAALLFGRAGQLLDGIESARFARLARGEIGVVPANHPAWVYGHIALYPEYALRALGLEDAADALTPDDAWTARFDFNSQCQDDPDASFYPPMATIVRKFNESFESLLEGLDAADPDALGRDNPREGSRERFPRVGDLVNFLATGHVAYHLGQVSYWRRLEGLPPV